MNTIKLTGWLERGVNSVCCTQPNCNGYCYQVEATPEEEKEFGCGRLGCCARAFICKRCGQRYAAKAEAPEMEDL